MHFEIKPNKSQNKIRNRILVMQLYLLLEKMHTNQFQLKVQEEMSPQRSIKMSETTILKDIFLINKSSLSASRLQTKTKEWTILENAKYAAFIDKNEQKMEGKPHAELWPLYSEMGNLIKSRNFRQCKIYHQKMLLKHQSIRKILNYFIQSFPIIGCHIQKERDQRTKNNQKQEINNKKKINLILQNEVKKDNRKTCVSYEEQGQNNEKCEQKNNCSHSLNFNFFPLSSELKQKYQEDLEWKQCHNLFLEWTNKLNSLINP